jgi:hypothetical protein
MRLRRLYVGRRRFVSVSPHGTPPKPRRVAGPGSPIVYLKFFKKRICPRDITLKVKEKALRSKGQDSSISCTGYTRPRGGSDSARLLFDVLAGGFARRCWCRSPGGLASHTPIVPGTLPAELQT